MSYKDSLDYLYSLERFGMIFGLDNISRLLSLLGDPHRRLRTVHITGSNGKGSVSAMMAEILSRRWRVGLYTSPHLHSFTERVKINDREIEEGEVVRLVELLRRKVEKEGGPEHFTFFDFTTAITFQYFAEKEVDLAVIEVGLGGRLDSTNVITPQVSVITTVSKEHTQVLGSSLSEIAREKAGIIKEEVPVVCGVREEEALKVIEEEAKEKGAPLFLLGRDFHYRERGAQQLDFSGRRWRMEGLEVGLLGRFQLFNASLAIAALEVLAEKGYAVSEADIREGLQEIRWPGRMEVVRKAPLLILDGAHNGEGARALKEALRDIRYRELLLLLGIMDDKDVEAIVRELAPLARLVVTSRPSNPRALPPRRIAEVARRFCPRVKEREEMREGVSLILEEASREDLVLITGSLFTVADARQILLGGEG